jgi:1-acyl-sn-glycerol-3-phosphate acyltransferase
MKKKMIDFLKRFVFSYLLIKVSFGAIVWFYLRIIHRKQIRIIGQENIVQPEIIPIKIIGAEKILPRGKEWPDWSKGKITIIFGQSIANRLNRYRKGLYKHLPKKFIYSRIVKIMREELKKLPPSGES